MSIEPVQYAEFIALPLVGGGVTLVSVSDLKLVAPHRWRKHVTPGGYADVRTKNSDGKPRSLLLHRLILGLKPGDGLEGDHRNGNTLDNRRENLRVSTRTQNAANRHKKAVTIGGWKGVYRTTKTKNRFYASIGAEGRYLGSFGSAIEAAAAYNEAAKARYGEFAWLNDLSKTPQSLTPDWLRDTSDKARYSSCAEQTEKPRISASTSEAIP